MIGRYQTARAIRAAFEERLKQIARAQGIYLRRLHVKYQEFTGSVNPPIPHRKETFVTENNPGRDKFARLTAQEERLSPLTDNSSIGTKERWEQIVASKGLRFAGHHLVRRKSLVQSVGDPSSSMESCQRTS